MKAFVYCVEVQHQRPPKSSSLSRSDAARLDGVIENAMTGAGIGDIDPTVASKLQPVYYWPHLAKRVYRASWAAGREIDRPASDLIAGGMKLEQLPEGFDAEAIVSYLSELGTEETPEDRGMLPALSRLYAEGNKLGGAALVVVLDDGLEPWEPVDLTRIREVVSLELLERDEITPWRSKIGGPIDYYIVGTNRTDLEPASIVHASRVIVSKGMRLGPSEEWAALGWGASVLERLHNERLAMHTANQEAAAAILRATFDVVYFAELAEMLCDEKATGSTGQGVSARLALLSRTRSQHRLIPLDAGREALGEDEPARPSDKMESIARPVDGLHKLHTVVSDHWASGTGQTPSIALGKQVGGLNTGANAGDWQGWSSYIDGQRETWLLPRADWIITLVCASKLGPTGGRIPDTWAVVMRPLWIPPAKDVASEAKIWAEVDQIYAGLQAVDSDELRGQRFEEGATGQLRLEPRAEPDPLLSAVGEDASKQALNGAQIQALFELAASVGAGIIPIETAIWLVLLAVPGLDEAAARRALDAAARAGVPEAAPEAVPELAVAVEPLAAEPTPPDVLQDARAAWLASRADGRHDAASVLDVWRRAWP